MKIIFVSSEIVPFASTGGLGDVCAALPKALAEKDVKIVRIMPLYQDISREKHRLIQCETDLHIPLGNVWHSGTVWKQESDGIVTFFIHSGDFFERPGIYDSSVLGYDDNFERFLFFQKAVVQLIDQWRLEPDIVHCNDWQTGLLPMLLYHGIDGSFRNGREKTLITIHNSAHQGWAPAEKFYMTQLPSTCYTMHTLECYGEINALKGGLASASTINTVSPRYAAEIKTPEFGCRLEGVLKHRSNDLSGILNGIDCGRWDPEQDKKIPKNYSAADFSGKAVCKTALQKECGFLPQPNVPLLAMITRLVPQKGIDLLAGVIERIVAEGSQIVILGTGETRYEAACREWMRRWPKQVRSWIEFSEEKAHRIEAGADIFLMPSKFEPCGQNQMYSMRYGTVPLVHAVGGLDDSVIDYAEKDGTGFKFYEYSAHAFFRCVERAIRVFANTGRWNFLIRRAMTQDFSMAHMADDYIALYNNMLSSNETMG